MAFPQIAAASGSVGSGNSHIVSLPSGISAGQLLLAVLSVSDAPTVTFPAGWTTIITQNAGGNVRRLVVAYRFTDGSEGSSITVLTSTNELSGHVVLRITGAHPSTPPEGTSTSNGTGSSNQPDPPALNPTGWDVEDTLWIAVAGTATNAGTLTGVPANYGTLIHQTYDNTADVGVAPRNLASASEDPGAFTSSASGRWISATVAIRPRPATSRSYVFFIGL